MGTHRTSVPNSSHGLILVKIRAKYEHFFGKKYGCYTYTSENTGKIQVSVILFHIVYLDDSGGILFLSMYRILLLLMVPGHGGRLSERWVGVVFL